MDAG
jgi:hypothetical protein